MFDRLLKLIKESDFEKIQNAHILLVGVGGVGGYVLEALVRSGFLHITIIDGDVIDITNLNRQIIATSCNLGLTKVKEAKKRALEINKNVEIDIIDSFLTKDNFDNYVKDKYDYIIDAIDDIYIKIELIKYALNNNMPIICSLGTGRKFDPTKLEITTLDKTYNDPLAKKLRSELRKENISLKIPVVFSKEEALNIKEVGSAIFVPASAGILIASHVFQNIIKQ